MKPIAEQLEEIKMNENLKSRLINFKFNSACKYLEGEAEEVHELVHALSRCFGNSGCFDGDLGFIVSAAIKSIGVSE